MDLLDTMDVDLGAPFPPSSPSSYQSTPSSVTALTEAGLFSRSHTTAELLSGSGRSPQGPPAHPSPPREQKADILVQCGDEAPAAQGAKVAADQASDFEDEEPLEAVPLTVDHRPGEPSEMGELSDPRLHESLFPAKVYLEDCGARAALGLKPARSARCVVEDLAGQACAQIRRGHSVSDGKLTLSLH